MSTPIRRSRAAIVVAAVGIACAGTTAFAQDMTNLAGQLASLRGDVEKLSSELSEDKSELQDELRTLARQKSELVLENDREAMRLQKLRMTLAEKQGVIEEQKNESVVLLPAFDKVAEALKGHIKSSLPFRSEERVAEVEKIQEQLKSGLFSPEQATARLWALVEDEHRLTRENGLYRQTVEIDGSEQLVDVARVGMAMLYFRADEGKVGYAQRSGSGWTYVLEKNPESVKLIDNLFETFKKQIRVGYFELPNPGLGGKP